MKRRVVKFITKTAIVSGLSAISFVMGMLLVKGIQHDSRALLPSLFFFSALWVAYYIETVPEDD